MNSGRLLAGSVVLNLGLAGVIAWRFLGAASPAPASPPPAASRPMVTKVWETNEVIKAGAVVRQDWRSVEDEDYRKYIAQLRATGCPEETIRDIIILDLNKQFIERWRAAHPPKPFKFWDTSGSAALRAAGRNREEREREQAQLELSREKRGLIRELLGVDLAEELAKYHMSNSRADLENMWTFLAPEKRDVVQQIQSKYTDLMQGVRAKADPDGRLSPELQQELKNLKAQNEAELAQAMTPAELEQYQLRMSATAANVRLALSAFEPTEDEYKRVFPLRKAYDDIYADPGFDRTDPDQVKQRTAAYREMEEKIRTVLTPERYAEYERSRDADYRDANVFVKIWELPKETTLKLYEVKRVVDARVREVKGDATLDDNARRTMLAAVQTEAQQALKTMLGDRAYQGYLRSRANRTSATFE